MMSKISLKTRIFSAIFGCIFGILGIISPILASPTASAIVDGENNTTTSSETTTENTTETTTNNTEDSTKDEEPKKTRTCNDSLGSIGWLVCPTTGKIAEAVDWLYAKNKDLLEVNPVIVSHESPVYSIWSYFLNVANIAFVAFLLIAVYSQITGVGISNYGIKKILPKLIIAAVMVNLSFIICSLAVDVSNIIGQGLRGIFTSIENNTISDFLAVGGQTTEEGHLAMAAMWNSLADGTALAALGGTLLLEGGEIFLLIPAALGALVAVVVGLITIALRQVVVILLIMIAPLAIVAYMLPNTEKWYKQWQHLLMKMLVFYPMYSLLFGASSLAGWAIINTAQDGFGIILGVAVQIFPLFFSWSLMKMSGTFLGTINARITGFFAVPLATNRAWAESHRDNIRANTLANGITPSARLRQFLSDRRALREEDTKNALGIASGRSSLYVQRKIADSDVEDAAGRSRRTSRYTRNAKAVRNYNLMSQNAIAHTEHVMDHYGSYFNKNGDLRDKALDLQSQRAWVDAGRANFQKEIDEEDDINFMIDKYLAANKRDKDNNPADPEAFKRYVSSVTGIDGEQRLSAKIIAQAAKVENKQRSEYNVLYAKYGHNGYNKRAFRDWIVGYKTNDDGWAVDENGERLKDENGNFIEVVQGDAITKAPNKLVLYNKRDSHGLYYDFKDQNGNVIARIHRGLGDDGENHDDAAFIKESLSNYDIPIADPINNVYSILSGVNPRKADKDGNVVPGDVVTDEPNEIGLSRYSTTIGRAMKEYKGNAAWAGAMFNSGIGNRQIKNSSQHAIWVLDSIKKTLKPGAFNTQNPASVEYITSIMDPDNWSKIFTEEELKNAANINNELYGGEDWITDDDGNVVSYQKVDNPTYEQRMNTLKRKLLYPAMQKVLPAFDRLRTSNTADNQKPGTADEQYKFLKMVEDKWENNPAINFDPTLVDQDLPSEARAFRQRKHDKDGNLIYATDQGNPGSRRGNAPRPDDAQPSNDRSTNNLMNELEDVYSRCTTPEELVRGVFQVLNSKEEYGRALQRFDELLNENPDATMHEIYDWFPDLDMLVN